uniref:Uncharacterized protein n=1 Tax=Rangifer tarandus platyrhynchus TaxID=3082113 RepID=A0ACB0E8D8_RANTA|nr:unnamed protein product [Rangifer tarandus platyrhynchus]
MTQGLTGSPSTRRGPGSPCPWGAASDGQCGGWWAAGEPGSVSVTSATGSRGQTPQAAEGWAEGARSTRPAAGACLERTWPARPDLGSGWRLLSSSPHPAPEGQSAARPGGPAVGDEDCASAPQSAVRGPDAGGRRCRSGSSFASASAASGAGPSERKVSVDAPRRAPPEAAGQRHRFGRLRKDSGLAPRGHLAAPAPPHPRALGGAPRRDRTDTPGPRCAAARLPRTRSWPGTAVQLLRRQGAPGALWGPWPCRPASALSSALDKSLGQLRRTLCKVQPKCRELRALRGRWAVGWGS